MTRINVTLVDEQLELLDEYLAFIGVYGSRDEFIRSAIRDKIENSWSFRKFLKKREEEECIARK